MKKNLTKIIIIMFILLFSTAFSSCDNKNGIIFKGDFYEEVSSNIFKNDLDQHIYIEEVHVDDKFEITIRIENDDTNISFPDGIENFVIEIDENVVTGHIEQDVSEFDQIYKDYIELINSYVIYSSTMDEFPEALIYSIFGFLAFIFGIIFVNRIINYKKAKANKVTHLISLLLSLILFTLSLGLLLKFIFQNI